jgi:hypothetical protein
MLSTTYEVTYDTVGASVFLRSLPYEYLHSPMETIPAPPLDVEALSAGGARWLEGIEKAF